ncbi:MAG TPA: hypothetical protein VMI12_08030 [Puia sp.]|nr:hypothetical protein [Puia sp.]
MKQGTIPENESKQTKETVSRYKKISVKLQYFRGFFPADSFHPQACEYLLASLLLKPCILRFWKIFK